MTGLYGTLTPCNCWLQARLYHPTDEWPCFWKCSHALLSTYIWWGGETPKKWSSCAVKRCCLGEVTPNNWPKYNKKTFPHSKQLRNNFSPPLFFNCLHSQHNTVWLASLSELEVLHQSLISTVTVPLTHNKLLIICLTTVIFHHGFPLCYANLLNILCIMFNQLHTWRTCTH